MCRGLDISRCFRQHQQLYLHGCTGVAVLPGGLCCPFSGAPACPRLYSCCVTTLLRPHAEFALRPLVRPSPLWRLLGLHMRLPPIPGSGLFGAIVYAQCLRCFVPSIPSRSCTAFLFLCMLRIPVLLPRFWSNPLPLALYTLLLLTIWRTALLPLALLRSFPCLLPASMLLRGLALLPGLFLKCSAYRFASSHVTSSLA